MHFLKFMSVYVTKIHIALEKLFNAVLSPGSYQSATWIKGNQKIK